MIVWLAVALVMLALPLSALAHGSHNAPPPQGSTSAGTTEGYTVQLASEPAPLVVGRPARVMATIVDPTTGTPVSGAAVQIGVSVSGAPSSLAAAAEVTWAGTYVVPFTPKQTGVHDVRVVVAAAHAPRREPFAAQLQIPVTRPAASAWPLGMAISLAAVIVVLGLWVMRVRARDPAAHGDTVDLLRVPWLRRVLTSRVLQPALQGPLLVLTGIVVFLGFADVADGGRNVATKLTWTIWWAGVIFTFVFVGRVWCLACPFGALNEWAARLSGAWRRLPRPFRNLWWATALFVLLTWADELLGVVRSPNVTAWIIVGFAVLAVAIGLRYERRSFCRYLCPIGGLIGIYSMTAPLELRARDGGTCRGHADKQCYAGGLGGRGCPMFEFPHAMDRNNYCTLCAECVKSCSRDNIALRLRAFGKDLWVTGRRALDEAYLAIALVGLTLLVTAQMLTGWPQWISALARWLPAIVRTELKPVTYLTLVESTVLLVGALVVAPLLLLGAAATAERLAGDRSVGLRRAFVLFGYMFVPVGLAMHLAHNLSHLLLEGPGIVPAIQRAAQRYTSLTLGEPDWQIEALAPEPVVGLLQVAVILGFFALSLYAGHRLALRAYADRGIALRALVPFALLSFGFTVVGILLVLQPMGMRHGV